MNIQKPFLSLIFLLFCIRILTGQQTDSLQQVKFAYFLEEGKLHRLAAEEFDRLAFLYPHEDEFVKRMLTNYRLAGATEVLLKKLEADQPRSPTYWIQYYLSLRELGAFDETALLIERSEKQLPPEISHRMRMDLAVLKGEYKKAGLMYEASELEDTDYADMLQKATSLPTRSPFVAGLLSGLVPGVGRFYAGDYKDGIISMIFVGSTAYQAYRRFKKQGADSVGGWIYGGIALGFYVGNIYGSVQSAKSYNRHQTKKFNEANKRLMDLYYADY